MSEPSEPLGLMRAVAVRPGSARSAHLRHAPRPSIAEVPAGQGVRLRVLRVGLCGTDEDLDAGTFGSPPEGEEHLVIGHENLCQVLEVGPLVEHGLRVGQLVVGTVRRPGNSPWDRIGLQDLTSDSDHRERGLNRLHGYLSEETVEDARYLVPVPDAVGGTGVLTEPMSGVIKGLRVADEIQRRLRIWTPERGLVLGAGTIGLLAVMALRQRGVAVTCFSRRRAPYRNSNLVGQVGGRYVSAADMDLAQVGREHGPFDLIFEASGAVQLIFPAAGTLAANGVMVLFGVTSGSQVVQVDVARLNQAFVLGNRALVGSVNATREDYESAVETMARAEADPATTDWPGALLTTRIDGFDIEAIRRQLADRGDAIKAFVELARTTEAG